MFRNNLIARHVKLLTTFRANVSIWSPLAEAFNTLPSPKYQVKTENVGLFSVPELTAARGFYDMKEECILKTNSLINEALSTWRSRKMVDIFDEISDTLCQVADLAEFIRLSHPQQEFNYAAQIACATVSGIVEKLNTNIELYEVLKNAVRNGDVIKSNHVDNHVGELFLFDFEQCGIHLPDDKRNKVVQLNDIILNLGKYLILYFCMKAVV